IVNGEEIRGFKVMLGGGLGSQPLLAHEIFDFLAENQIIPYMEATLRVFDRYGERNNRNKARFKYLVQKLGLEEVLRLIEEEKIAIKSKAVEIDRETNQQPEAPISAVSAVEPVDAKAYAVCSVTNVFEQKQKGYFGVYVKILTGDISTEKARVLFAGIRDHIAD